jgi:S-adenosylmethionine:tRNA ribosyltransferase-isomerase
MGVRVKSNPGIEEDRLFTDQWEPYSVQASLTSKDALSELLKWMKLCGIQTLSSSTRIMIVPGYEFRICSGIITNFHLPGSTLILLVAAFTGDAWRKIYDYALDNDFRFLSYGDASLLLK